MKELYIAPEAEIIRFAPYEKLAFAGDWETGVSEIEATEGWNPEDGEKN